MSTRVGPFPNASPAEPVDWADSDVSEIIPETHLGVVAARLDELSA